ncbi:Rh156 [macacine betaherpesvirus 3]|nr:Rh156 [macacine betaherpesvirus 3]
MDSRKRKPEDETHTEEGGDPEEGTSGGPSTGPSPPKQARKDMALQDAVNLLEKMLAQEEERQMTEINLGDPLFEPVSADESIKSIEDIINEGEDTIITHQTIVNQIKLRVQRNREAATDIIRKQVSDIRKLYKEEFDKLEQGVQGNWLVLDKLKGPFQNMKCFYELANDQFNDTPMTPDTTDKFMLCLKEIIEFAVRSSPMLERLIKEKLDIRRSDLKYRVIYTCQKYIVRIMQSTGGPKTIVSEEQARIYLSHLANYDDLDQANEDGIKLVKHLDDEQKDVIFHKNNFDNLLVNMAKSMYNEGTQKIDEALLELHTPINMISDALKTLVCFIIDETTHAIYTDPTKANDDIIRALKPKIRVVMNEYYATLRVSSEQLKFYSLKQLREIVNDKLNEETFPVISGVPSENVPGADIPLASVIIHSDTEDDEEQESKADEEEQETETGDEGTETQAEETDETDIEGTESETQIGSEAQPEAAESETQVEKTEGETEVETPQETEEGDEESEKLEMTVIKYAKPHVKEEEGAGPSSKSKHHMQTRSKTDK